MSAAVTIMKEQKGHIFAGNFILFLLNNDECHHQKLLICVLNVQYVNKI